MVLPAYKAMKHKKILLHVFVLICCVWKLNCPFIPQQLQNGMAPLSKVNEVCEKSAIAFAPLYRMDPLKWKRFYVLRIARVRKCVRCTNAGYTKRAIEQFLVWIKQWATSFIRLTGHIQCGNAFPLCNVCVCNSSKIKQYFKSKFIESVWLLFIVWECASYGYGIRVKFPEKFFCWYIRFLHTLIVRIKCRFLNSNSHISRMIWPMTAAHSF